VASSENVNFRSSTTFLFSVGCLTPSTCFVQLPWMSSYSLQSTPPTDMPSTYMLKRRIGQSSWYELETWTLNENSASVAASISLETDLPLPTWLLGGPFLILYSYNFWLPEYTLIFTSGRDWTTAILESAGWETESNTPKLVEG
jgi:hypothetical protein